MVFLYLPGAHRRFKYGKQERDDIRFTFSCCDQGKVSLGLQIDCY